MYIFFSLLDMCLAKFISWYLTMWEFIEYGNISLESMEKNWRIWKVIWKRLVFHEARYFFF